MQIADIRPLDIDMDEHPINTERYLIPTEPIGRLMTVLEKIVRRRTSGLLIHGRPRYGKSKAIKYCSNAIKELFPGLPVCIFSAPKKMTSSEDAFYTNLLEALGHKQLRGKPHEKRQRILNLIYERANRYKRRMFLLFIDEAQKFFDEHFEWLRDIYDNLELHHEVRLVVVLVGQSELMTVKDQFLSARKDSIVARFMIQDMEFKGLSSAEEIKGCLGCYDEAVYPQDTDWTYTRAYFPKAFSNGFRMRNYGEQFWRIFGVHHRGNGQISDLSIPMKFFTKSIEIFFTEYEHLDDENLQLTDKLINEVVSETWYYIYQKDVQQMDDLD